MWMNKFIRKWKRSNRWKPPTCQVLLYNVVSSTHKRGESNSQLYFQNGLYLVRNSTCLSVVSIWIRPLFNWVPMFFFICLSSSNINYVSVLFILDFPFGFLCLMGVLIFYLSASVFPVLWFSASVYPFGICKLFFFKQEQPYRILEVTHIMMIVVIVWLVRKLQSVFVSTLSFLNWTKHNCRSAYYNVLCIWVLCTWFVCFL